jgi:ABC-type antimicrobial peptide transport system permease subunit
MFAIVEGMFAGWRQAIEEQGGIERLTVENDQIPEAQRAFRHLTRQRRRMDATAVMLSVPGVSVASPELFIRDNFVEYRGKREWCPLVGATDGIVPIGNHELAQGRFISDMDRKTGARVVVLGSSVAAGLFGDHAPALNRRVYIKGVPFRVIGVMANYELAGGGRGAHFMGWKNRFTFVPLETVMKRLNAGEDLSGLSFEVKDSTRLASVADSIRNTLFFLNRRIVNFAVRTNEEMLERFSEISGAFSLSLGIIAGISLLVGGIGIMNIMLASINERIREIGIRKAIGARERDIMTQVLVEAVVLSIIGGLLGVCMSLFLTHTVGAIIRNTFSRPIVRVGPLVFSFCVSVVIGIAFGLYPAFKAAKLDPIEALRYE